MIVEMLSLQVEPELFDKWVRVDRATWTAFLERQPGFVKKEVWLGAEKEVRVVVWWQSQDAWDAISEEQVAAVDASMGEWFRPSTLQRFTVA